MTTICTSPVPENLLALLTKEFFELEAAHETLVDLLDAANRRNDYLVAKLAELSAEVAA